MAASETKPEGEPGGAKTARGDVHGDARKGLSAARTGHPATNDAMARLRGAYESLSSGYCYYGEATNDDPPPPDVCRGVAAILREIAEDVEALAGVPDTDADPVRAAMMDKIAARVGKAISAENMEKIRALVDSHEKLSAATEYHATCMRSIEEMIDTVEDDTAEDDGTSVDADTDDEDAESDRAMSEAFAKLR